MGYRSQVGLACDPIIKDIIETLKEWDSEFKELFSCADDLSTNDTGRWHFDSVKWYESYSDVGMVENLMTMCDNSATIGLSFDSFGFVRLGEEMDDNEMRGCPASFDIYINRGIEI